MFVLTRAQAGTADALSSAVMLQSADVTRMRVCKSLPMLGLRQLFNTVLSSQALHMIMAWSHYKSEHCTALI